MIRNRVVAAGIVFCLLFVAILLIILSGQISLQSLQAPEPIMAENPADDGAETGADQPVITPGTRPPSPSPGSNQITGTGTILYLETEGGFYGIEGSDGEHYLPTELPADLRMNGTRVEFTLRPSPSTITMYMWGKPMDITSIYPLEPEELRRPSIPPIEYEKAGGVSDAYETLRINPDGSGEVRRRNQVQAIALTSEEMENLSKTTNLTDFSSLNPEYMPPGPVPDAIIHTITLGNKSVKTVWTETPVQILPLLNLLSDLLKKHTISPITASETLEGTWWRLGSYLRTDGIPVILPNNTPSSLKFEKENRVNGSTGCNTFTGVYNHSGTALSIGSIHITQQPCSEIGAREIEADMLRLLGETRMVSGEQRTLTMADSENRTLMVYEQMTQA